MSRYGTGLLLKKILGKLFYFCERFEAERRGDAYNIKCLLLGRGAGEISFEYGGQFGTCSIFPLSRLYRLDKFGAVAP